LKKVREKGTCDHQGFPFLSVKVFQVEKKGKKRCQIGLRKGSRERRGGEGGNLQRMRKFVP